MELFRLPASHRPSGVFVQFSSLGLRLGGIHICTASYHRNRACVRQGLDAALTVKILEYEGAYKGELDQQAIIHSYVCIKGAICDGCTQIYHGVRD